MLSIKAVVLLLAAMGYNGSSIVGAAPVSQTRKLAATTDIVSYSRRALIDTVPNPTGTFK